MFVAADLEDESPALRKLLVSPHHSWPHSRFRYCGYSALFRATGRPDTKCKFFLDAPDRFGISVDGLPAHDSRSSFTKDLTAQLEQAVSA
jgi:hypothetical protein